MKNSTDESIGVDSPFDPRVEAMVRTDLPLWSGTRFDAATSRHQEWRRIRAAALLAAADAVDPLRKSAGVSPFPLGAGLVGE